KAELIRFEPDSPRDPSLSRPVDRMTLAGRDPGFQRHFRSVSPVGRSPLNAPKSHRDHPGTIQKKIAVDRLWTTSATARDRTTGLRGATPTPFLCVEGVSGPRTRGLERRDRSP